MEECSKCSFRFHTIGDLSAFIRKKHHMRKKHTIPCGSCGKDFVSDSHLAVHKYLSHDIECIHCKQACEGRCSEYFSKRTEKVGDKRMEVERQTIMDMVSNHLLLIQFLNFIFFLKNNENYS